MPQLPAAAAAMTDRAASPSPSSTPPSRPGDAAALGAPILPTSSISTRPTRSERGDKPDPPPNGPRQRLREDRSRMQRHDWSRLHVDGPQLDGWYIAKIVLRSISCILMLTTVAMYIVIILPTQGVISATDYRNRLNAPIASGMHAAFGIFAVTTLFWDTAEFITMCCRKGYGITPKAHIGIELTLFLWGAGTVSLVTMMAVVPVWYARYFPAGSGFSGVEEVTSVAVMGGLIVIIRFILFVRNAIDRCGYRGLTPRIMYLQTGEPVVVMRKPYPPPPTRQEPDIEMGNRAAAAAASSSASTLVASPPRPSLWGAMGRRLLLRGKKGPPPVVVSTGRGSSSPQPMSPEAEVPERAVVVGSPPQQSRQPQEQLEREPEQPLPQTQQRTNSPPSSPQRQQVPRRRPVPTRNGCDCYDGPVPDYEPDEAERRRAERGEAQAQWMTLEARGIRGPASGKRRGADGDRQEEEEEAGGRDLEESR